MFGRLQDLLGRCLSRGEGSYAEDPSKYQTPRLERFSPYHIALRAVSGDYQEIIKEALDGH